jgi:hypothetical protein
MSFLTYIGLNIMLYLVLYPIYIVVVVLEGIVNFILGKK